MEAKTVTVGGDPRRIEPFSGRKTNRVLRIVRNLAQEFPGLLSTRAAFLRTYEEQNVLELDRAQAIVRYGQPTPVRDGAGEVVRNEDGSVATVPSPITQMSEEDWQRSGHKLRLSRSPDWAEQMWALLPEVMDVAEEQVLELLALVLMSNADVKRYHRAGELNSRRDDLGHVIEGEEGKLHEAGQDLLDDALGDELIEIAVVAGELVDEQFLSKAKELRGRLGNALRLFGLAGEETTEEPSPTRAETTTQTSEPTPSSSTDSPEPSTGGPTPSSTAPSSSS